MSRGLAGIKTIDEIELKNKNVFIRVDFNVPMEQGKITDDQRIRAALPTIQHALTAGAKVILASHLGRPKEGESRKKYSLLPVGQRLAELMNVEVIMVDDLEKNHPKTLLENLRPNQIILLENLRFDRAEEENGVELARKWAQFSEVYVNDAFGASHRAHASIVALPSLVPVKAMGFLVKKEIAMLEKLLERPEKPYCAILGGSKVSDKIGVIENLIDLVDCFIIGGAMAYTFLKVQGVEVGGSLVEQNKLSFAREMLGRLDARKKKILLPVDHVIAPSIEGLNQVQVTDGASIPTGWMGFDIGPKSQKLFSQEISHCKTIFWNGPMGVFEQKPFSQGTFAIAKALAELSGVTTIIGGGDSAAAAKESGFAERMTHISTGGGASLEYLQGDPLPGVEALRVKARLT